MEGLTQARRVVFHLASRALRARSEWLQMHAWPAVSIACRPEPRGPGVRSRVSAERIQGQVVVKNHRTQDRTGLFDGHCKWGISASSASTTTSASAKHIDASTARLSTRESLSRGQQTRWQEGHGHKTECWNINFRYVAELRYRTCSRWQPLDPARR